MTANETTISYRTMKHGEETATVDLVLRVFAEFVAPQYPREGIAEFRRFACADALADRFRAGNLILLAEAGQDIIGVIEIRDNDHIALLFVEKSFQREGIAKELLLRSIEICRKRKPDIDRITVNSSPNAFGAYQKMGFKGSRDEKVVNGIRFIPMELSFDEVRGWPVEPKKGHFIMTNEQEQKTAIRNTFNIVAEGYDNPSFRFFTISGELMTVCLDLKGNERVLDVATGTGIVALQLAPLLPRGRVTAIDFSEGMLAQARMKAAARAVDNIDFLEMDMQALRFPDGYFDTVTCAFGIFFVEDMESQLRHMSDKVKAGGKIILSTFYDGSFMPFAELFYDCLQRYGIERPVPTWKRISTEDKCAALLGSAGLSGIQVETRDIGYYLSNTDEWWDVIWNGGFRRYLNVLSTRDLAEFRKEHLAEVGKAATEKGLRLDVKVMYAVGSK